MVPMIGSHGLNVNNEIYAWSYVVFTFILFTVALAVMRNLYRNYTGRKNIKKEIRKRMKRALGEYIIEGVKTTIPLHQKLMEDENFVKGNFTTKFMDSFEY